MATIPLMVLSACEPDSSVRRARPPRRVIFPSEAEVPEGKRHLELRTFPCRLLEAAFRDRGCHEGEK